MSEVKSDLTTVSNIMVPSGSLEGHNVTTTTTTTTTNISNANNVDIVQPQNSIPNPTHKVSNDNTPVRAKGSTILPHPQSVPPPVQVGGNHAQMEQHKNAIVADMLQRIKPFVDGQGHFYGEADMEAFAVLMAGESHFLQRTLLLTVLLNGSSGNTNGGNGDILKRMAVSGTLIRVLSEWMSAAYTQKDSALLAKLLDVFGRLPLGLDALVEFRLGKVVKRVVQVPEVRQDVRDKAADLCEKWTKLALYEDKARRRTNSVPLNNHHQTVNNNLVNSPNRRSSSADAHAAVANPDFFVTSGTGGASANGGVADTVITPPLLKQTRAEQILERVARGESAKLETRPMSADDIHKAKKRQQYMQMLPAAASAAVAIDGDVHADADASVDDTLDIPMGKRPAVMRKRVAFAEDGKLVTVHVFETPEEEEEEQYEHHYADRQEMDKDEASFAFKQASLSMEAECEWRTPKPLAVVVDRQPYKGLEREVEEQRERTALSAVYYSMEDVPPSPSESIVDSTMQDLTVPVIPLKDSEGRVTPVLRMVNPPTIIPKVVNTTTMPPPPLNTNLLSTLLQNPNALQDILKNIPSTNNGVGVMGVRPSSPPPPPFPIPMPMNLPNGMMFPPPMSFRPMHHRPIPPPLAFPPTMDMMYPRPMPPYNPSQYSTPQAQYTQSQSTQYMQSTQPMQQKSHQQQSRRSLCKFYRRGQPNSCKFGSSCQFLHAD